MTKFVPRNPGGLKRFWVRLVKAAKNGGKFPYYQDPVSICPENCSVHTRMFIEILNVKT